MIYHAFRKHKVGDIINIDYTSFEVIKVKVFGKVKTLTMYEYKLKELPNDQDKK